MQTKRRDIFTTIKTEGAILPPDLLQRIAAGDSSLPGLSPESYHLTKRERVNEAANRSWNRLLGAWAAFKDAAVKLPESDAGTSLTRERWLQIIFQELGYGRLLTSKAIEIEGKSYPVSHMWQQTPIHLVGFRIDLDTRTRGVAGAARFSPHSLVQEFLNRNESCLWGLVSNGYKLRILRDNVSLTRAAYVEFDLQAMMDGEVYSDFVLLWLMAHQSRVEIPEGKRADECWLEKWSKAAADQGTRVLEDLRRGVMDTISALGSGFLAYSGNTALREQLRSGQLDTQDFYRELLRLVYQMIFLFVAEDRELLLDPKAPAAARELYADYYSTARLRRLAERRRGTRHPDLYRGLRIVQSHLHDGCPEIALPALGSYLFRPEATEHLNAAETANSDFLVAIRHLAFTIDGNTRRPVDYRNLGPEELGSVYESLLELHPELHAEAAAFELKTAAGSERKTTGSYYTPTSLVICLLDSALDPVIDEALKKPDPEKALLDLKICDPACGSGHILIAAAHRLAKRLAAVRTGDDEPSPEATRTALRDVISHCIYGVDLNPMAVELCKFNLWMEALEPGKPLSFLDHHIKCGNSLLGTTPALLEKGIPDEAFEHIEGDDKEACRMFKAANKQERKDYKGGQYGLFGGGEWKLGNMTGVFANLETIDDSSPEGVHKKEEVYADLVKSSGYLSAGLLADAWCAAFVWKKDKPDIRGGDAITEAVFRKMEKNPHSTPPHIREEIQRLKDEYRFFHWHLEFPQVFRLPAQGEKPENGQMGWSGGFDCVLGNPPWETLSPDAKEFFSVYEPEVRFKDRQGQRRIIENLLKDNTIQARWLNHCRRLYAAVHFLKASGRFRLYAPGNLGKGDFNIFRMFVETALDLCACRCWAAQIVPEGLYNGPNCMAIRQELFAHFTLATLLCFENTREVWFKGVDSRAKFCLYAAQKAGTTVTVPVAFNIRSESDLGNALSTNNLLLPLAMIREFSPEAIAIAELGSQLEINIASRMYSHCPKFGDDSAGPPRRTYMREIDMGNDRDLFDESPAGLPLYEGRMIWHYDHRAKGYRSGRGRKSVWEELQFGRTDKSIQPQWHIPASKVPEKTLNRVAHYRIGFCDVCSPTNERSLVAAIVPPNCICGHKVPTITFEPSDPWYLLAWIAVANTHLMDFLARKKISLTMSYTVLDSLPFPQLIPEAPVTRALVWRALLLTCTAPEMNALWQQMAAQGWVVPDQPSGVIADDARLTLLAEIEAIVASCVYGVTKEELGYVFETFPIVKKRDKAKFITYRTKESVLGVFDEMAEAIRTDKPYQTHLDPPPSDPRVAHLPRTATRRPEPVRPRVYPSTQRERVLCAVSLALVSRRQGIVADLHLDAMLAATHSSLCEAVLAAPQEVRRLRKALKRVPAELATGEHESIEWRRVRNYLENAKAVAIGDRSGEQSLTTDDRGYAKVASSLPAIPDELIDLALAAADRMHADKKASKLFVVLREAELSRVAV